MKQIKKSLTDPFTFPGIQGCMYKSFGFYLYSRRGYHCSRGYHCFQENIDKPNFNFFYTLHNNSTPRRRGNLSRKEIHDAFYWNSNFPTPYEPVSPSIGWSVALLVGLSVLIF